MNRFHTNQTNIMKKYRFISQSFGIYGLTTYSPIIEANSIEEAAIGLHKSYKIFTITK